MPVSIVASLYESIEVTQIASEALYAATIILVMLACCDPASAFENSCERGTYKLTSEEHTCLECAEGTFMPEDNHQYTMCADCTRLEDPNLEVLISSCTKTRDADIQCVDGYYRVLARNPRSKPVCKECNPCHELLHEIRRCQNYSDTWCCPDVNYDYEYDKHGTALCRERPWMCRKGQYMDTLLNDCKPCPDGTFMSVDYHSYTECWNCQYHSDVDLPLHTEIIQQCNSTHPTVYACKEGYYINHSLGYRGDDIGCLPCQSCSVEKIAARPCDRFHDTVCCHHLDTVVVDGLNRIQCLKDEDKKTSMLYIPSSEGKVSVMNETTENRINDTDSEKSCDDDAENGVLYSLLVLLLISLAIHALMIIRCTRKYLNKKAKKIVTKANTRSASPGKHPIVSDCTKSDSRGSAVQESEQAMLLNDENKGLVRDRSVAIALVGKTGNGKSTTGNTILGKDEFLCSDSMSSVTRLKNVGCSEFRGTALKVMDIPGVGEGRNEITTLKEHLVSLFSENQQGIVVVTMIIKYGGRFTKYDDRILKMLRSTFGKDFIKNHVIVIMTFGDNFEKHKGEQTQTFQEWCAKQVGPFAHLIKECEQRVILFDNTAREKREEYIQNLLEKINNTKDRGRKKFASKGREIIGEENTDHTGATAGVDSAKQEKISPKEDPSAKCKYEEQDEIKIQPMESPGARKKVQGDQRQPESKHFLHGSATIPKTDA